MIVNRYNARWETDILKDGVYLDFMGRIAP